MNKDFRKIIALKARNKILKILMQLPVKDKHFSTPKKNQIVLN